MKEEEIIYKNIRKDFDDKIEKVISSELQKFEIQRKCIHFLSKMTVLMLIIILIVFIKQIILNLPIAIIHLLVLIFIAIPLLYKKWFEKRLKRKIMPLVCECFPDLQWEESPIFYDHDIFKKSNLIPDGTIS